MNGYEPGKILTVIVGIMSTLITAGIIAMVGMMIGMGNRLTGIETTVNESRMVRERQDRMLDQRIDRLERYVYIREDREQGR